MARHYNPKIELIKSAAIVLAVVVALFLLASWLFANILFYLLISVVIATILRPIVESISRRQIFGIQVPRALGIIFSFVLLLAVFTLFVVQFIPLVSDQVETIVALDYNKFYYQVTQPIGLFEGFLIKLGLTQHPPGFIVENLRKYFIDMLADLEVSSVINSVLEFTGNIFIGLIAVIFITYFLLQDKRLLRRQFIGLIPNQYFEVCISAVYKIEKLLSNYLIGLLFQMFAIFSLASLGLGLVGVKYSLTIAVFAAVANLIPYAGPILGATFGVIVALSTTEVLPALNDYIFLVVKILIVFSIVQLTDNLVLQPLIFSKSVKAHPLEIFLVIFAGASLGGQMGNVIVGMILAVPIYTVVRVMFVEFYKGYSQYQVFKRKN